MDVHDILCIIIKVGKSDNLLFCVVILYDTENKGLKVYSQCVSIDLVRVTVDIIWFTD